MIIETFIDIDALSHNKRLRANQITEILNTLSSIQIEIDPITAKVIEVRFSNGQKEKFH